MGCVFSRQEVSTLHQEIIGRGCIMRRIAMVESCLGEMMMGDACDREASPSITDEDDEGE